MDAAPESNVDYAVQGRAALARVERETAELDAVPRRVSMCREGWRDYGSALLAQRELMPSNNEFGQWVKAHGLDTGVASTHSARSDAMWLATHVAVVYRVYNGNAHHPSVIRRECREAGYEWAHDLPMTTQRRADSRRSKARAASPPYSWQRVAADEGVAVLTSGTVRTDIRHRLQAIDPDPALLEPEHETQLRAALVKLRAQDVPEVSAAVVTAARETVPESQRVRYDKAIARATAALTGAHEARMRALQESYEQAVNAGIEARLAQAFADERRRLAEAIERNTRAMEEFLTRRDGIKRALTKAEWKYIRGCLHSDHLPDEWRARFDEAFKIFNRLESYVNS